MAKESATKGSSMGRYNVKVSEGTGKEIFMRARAGNINISFSSEEEAKRWEDRIKSTLKVNSPAKTKTSMEEKPSVEEKKPEDVLARKIIEEGISKERGHTEEPEEDVIIRRSGKDLDITFITQERAEEWRNQLARIMVKDGYHLGREKPEAMQGEVEAAGQ